MLVDDRVEGIALEHQRQVVQLHPPDTVVGQAFGDVANKGAGVLEVVEHRDAGDNPRLAVGMAGGQRPAGEEVVDHLVALLDRVAGDVGGVEAEVGQPLGLVAVEQGAVVAADVDDQVAGGEADQALGFAGDLMEVLGHRPVDAAAVPVGAVEDRSRHRVAGLHQATSVLVGRHVAPHELQRHRALDRVGSAGVGEGAGDALFSEVQQWRQVRRSAHTAGGPGAQTGWCGRRVGAWHGRRKLPATG